MDNISIVLEKKHLDTDKQLVLGEVYAPGIIDAHGDIMSKEEIEKMAHDFLKLSYAKFAIDTNHDQTSNGAYPVESFIAREGDPDFTPGAWVLGVKIEDPVLWHKIKKGDLNGYSFQARVYKRPKYVELSVEEDNFLMTEKNQGHKHFAYVELDQNGRVRSGVTSIENGHFHYISGGTATDSSDNHAHRIFLEDL